MLRHPKEIEIMSRAAQANLRDPRRPRIPFSNILDDFFTVDHLAGKSILDLGPGQFDLGELVRPHAAIVETIDNDPAVIELGRYKGFPVFDLNLAELLDFARTHPGRYDGVFCKFSINAFWFANRRDLIEHVRALCALVKPGGWAWLAPWNGAYQDVPAALRHELLRAQIDSFVAKGFAHLELTGWQSRRYGINGLTANRPVFTRNLSFASPGMMKAFGALCQQRLVYHTC
jgi:hypothetical protein